MSRRPGGELRNGEALPLEGLPALSADLFVAEVEAALKTGARLSALLTLPGRVRGTAPLLAVLSVPESGTLLALRSLPVKRFPSLTPSFPQAHLFEREIFEASGVIPAGHPALAPVRFPPTAEADPAIGTQPFFQVEGGEVHEVAVG
ncbi:MAG TPA: NADH-quinone oxidoreductase subunit C, partial [Candidatus Aminicenantes bacterium]|nr:NADH-quinone oxidoreductase subunit C [Candidatus Aminicenantes bacterium]